MEGGEGLNGWMDGWVMGFAKSVYVGFYPRICMYVYIAGSNLVMYTLGFPNIWAFLIKQGNKFPES